MSEVYETAKYEAVENISKSRKIAEREKATFGTLIRPYLFFATVKKRMIF